MQAAAAVRIAQERHMKCPALEVRYWTIFYTLIHSATGPSSLLLNGKHESRNPADFKGLQDSNP